MAAPYGPGGTPLRARVGRRYLRRSAILPLGTHDFDEVLRRDRAQSEADAVLMLLVGSDAVRFNRAFAASGLDQRCLRLSTLMDENMLMASGAHAPPPASTARPVSSPRSATQDTLDFHGQYAGRFGVEAPPLGSLGESCYEGVLLLAALIDRARTLDVTGHRARPRTPSPYQGPRGLFRLRGSHVRQRIYLARADGVDFDVLAQLDLRDTRP